MSNDHRLLETSGDSIPLLTASDITVGIRIGTNKVQNLVKNDPIALANYVSRMKPDDRRQFDDVLARYDRARVKECCDEIAKNAQELGLE